MHVRVDEYMSVCMYVYVCIVMDLAQWLEHLHENIELSPLQPVPRDWFNKGRGMYYSLFGMVHIETRVVH